MNKPKKCKGTGKAIGYGCGKLNKTRKYGLGFECKCYQTWLFSTNAGKEVLNKSKITARKRVEKEKRNKERENKEKRKSIAQLVQEARKPFQRWVRKRDANKPCVSCGSVDSSIWDAGHFYKAEIYSGLIFHEDNVHKQCRKCNTYLNGNENNYRKGLEKRFGIDFLKELDNKANSLRSYKYTREELLSIKKEYQNKLKNE